MVEIEKISSKNLCNYQNLQDFGDIFDDIGNLFKSIIDQIKEIQDDIEALIDEIHCKLCDPFKNKFLGEVYKVTAFIVTQDQQATEQATKEKDQQASEACAACQRIINRRQQELEEQRKRIRALALMIYNSIYKYYPQNIILNKTRLVGAFRYSISNALYKWENISSRSDKKLYNEILKNLISQESLKSIASEYKKSGVPWNLLPRSAKPYHLKWKGIIDIKEAAGYDYRSGVKLKKGVRLHWYPGWDGHVRDGAFTLALILAVKKDKNVLLLLKDKESIAKAIDPKAKLWKFRNAVINPTLENRNLSKQQKNSIRKFWNNNLNAAGGTDKVIYLSTMEWLTNYPDDIAVYVEMTKKKVVVQNKCEEIKNKAAGIVLLAIKANKDVEAAIVKYKSNPTLENKNKLETLVKAFPFAEHILSEAIIQTKQCDNLGKITNTLIQVLNTLRNKINNAKAELLKKVESKVTDCLLVKGKGERFIPQAKAVNEAFKEAIAIYKSDPSPENKEKLKILVERSPLALHMIEGIKKEVDDCGFDVIAKKLGDELRYLSKKISNARDLFVGEEIEEEEKEIKIKPIHIVAAGIGTAAIATAAIVILPKLLKG